MAEYIDREVAKKMLDEYRISRTMSMYGDMDLLTEWREGVKCSMKKLDEVPTADVAPRSEVARLEQEIETLKDNNEHLAVMLMEAKAEVAREIFEEIDNILYRFAYPSLTAIGTINVINAEGYHLRTRDYAELKKKYTENENG